MSRLPAAQLGVLLMLVGMALFALNDAMGKWLVASYTVGQVLLIRSLAALVVLLPFLWSFGFRRLLQVERPGLQALRVLFASAEVFCFYLAVRDLPLADVMTFWLAAPIYVAAVSPFLLGERVGARRWIAIALGFVGVLIALAPSGAVSGTATVAAMIGWVIGKIEAASRLHFTSAAVMSLPSCHFSPSCRVKLTVSPSSLTS